MMDEKKDAVLDEAVDGGSEAETAEEGAAAETEPQDAATPADDGSVAGEGQGASPAEPEEAADQAEVTELEASVDAAEATEAAETTESAAAAEAAPAALEESKPEPKRKTGSGIGDLVAVGILSIILGVLLALPSFLGLTGGGNESAGSASAGVAATVNGAVIGEDEVTQYVMDFRTQNNLSEESAWGEWMVMYGYTPEMLRSDTIEMFVSRELIKQAVAEEGIEVADSEVDDFIASITEQVGGESALQEALEMEGITLESYRENVRLSLQQQALAEKVASGGEVDDAQVLEVVKMYYPDQVDKDAESLEGVDEATVEEVRSMLASAASQQAFEEWMQAYREKANVVIVDMPESLPYDIDLAPYQKQAESGDESTAESDGNETAEIELVDSSDEEPSAESQSASAESADK